MGKRSYLARLAWAAGGPGRGGRSAPVASPHVPSPQRRPARGLAPSQQRPLARAGPACRQQRPRARVRPSGQRPAGGESREQRWAGAAGQVGCGTRLLTGPAPARQAPALGGGAGEAGGASAAWLLEGKTPRRQENTRRWRPEPLNGCGCRCCREGRCVIGPL